LGAGEYSPVTGVFCPEIIQPVLIQDGVIELEIAAKAPSTACSKSAMGFVFFLSKQKNGL
jgi:hypothetical protein